MNAILKSSLSIDFPISYLFEPARASKKGLLVLHGFSDRADAVRKRLLGVAPLPALYVLAPNGLFPSPVRRGEELKDAYAWYYRDYLTKKEMVAPDFAAKVLMQLLGKLELLDLDWTILGFSQGGFLAPYLVRFGLNARTIISVGTAYRPESYVGLSNVKVYAIHGEEDQDVPYALAKSSFSEIQGMGYGESFHSLPGLGHTLNDEGRALVQKLILETSMEALRK